MKDQGNGYTIPGNDTFPAGDQSPPSERIEVRPVTLSDLYLSPAIRRAVKDVVNEPGIERRLTAIEERLEAIESLLSLP